MNFLRVALFGSVPILDVFILKGVLMEETLYKKIGRRYKPVGFEFSGFPADGIWLVLDGRQSMIIRLDEVGKELPLTAVTFREKKHDLAMHLASQQADGLSINQVAELACDFFAKLADGDIKVGERRW